MTIDFEILHVHTKHVTSTGDEQFAVENGYFEIVDLAIENGDVP